MNKRSIQERFGIAAEEGVAAANKLTDSQALTQARRNSGYIAISIKELPKPVTRKPVK